MAARFHFSLGSSAAAENFLERRDEIGSRTLVFSAGVTLRKARPGRSPVVVSQTGSLSGASRFVTGHAKRLAHRGARRMVTGL